MTLWLVHSSRSIASSCTAVASSAREGDAWSGARRWERLVSTTTTSTSRDTEVTSFFTPLLNWTYLGLQSPTRGFHLICSLSLRWTADWWRFLLEQHGIEAWDRSTLELLLPLYLSDSTTYILWIRSVYLTDIAMSCVCIWSGGSWLLNYLSFWSHPPLGIYFCFCFCFFSRPIGFDKSIIIKSSKNMNRRPIGRTAE